MKNRKIFKDFLSFAFFSFLVLYIFKNLLKLSLRKNIIGDLGDPLLNLFVLKHNIERILNLNFKDFFDTNIFYPYKFTLAFSENLISSSIFILPFYILSKNILISYNIFLILNFILSGFFMYLLAYHLTKNFFTSILAGILFSFAPFKFHHLGHLHVLTTMWIPLVFLFLHKFFEEKKKRFIFLSSLFFIIQSLGCANYMVIIAPFILIMFIFYTLKNIESVKKYFTGFLIFIILSGIFLIPLYYPYLEIEKLYGFKRSIKECIYFSPTLKSFLTTYPFTFTGKFLIKFADHPAEHEKTFYMGLIPTISIIFISFFILKRKIICLKFKKESLESKTLYFPYFEKININLTDFTLFYLITLFVSFLFLWGPLFFKIRYLYNPFYYIFYHFFPGAKGIRVPSRFFIIFLFSAAILISHFYSLYFKKRTIIILCLLTLFEFFPNYIHISSMPYKGKIPEVYKWLKQKDEKFAVMELPIEDSRTWGIPYGLEKGFFYLYFSSYHGEKIFNGHSGYESFLYTMAKNFDFKRQIELAKAINIRYLIIHKDVYKENPHVFPENTLENMFSLIENEYSDELLKVFEDEIATIYEIISRNKDYNPQKGYLKDYKFKIYFKGEDKNKGKLIFVYDDESPCVLIYSNRIDIKYYKEGKLAYNQKILINPKEHSPFLLKGEGFEKLIKLPSLKSGEYLMRVEEDGKIIGETKIKI